MRRVAAFVLLALALDFAVGSVLHRLFLRTMTGERGGLTNYALSKDADVLIVGSSRAQCHVMPSVLGEELSRPAFNAGLKGHGLLYAILLVSLWKLRHPPPSAVILTVDLDTMLRRESELAAIQLFAPYIDESTTVRDILYAASPYKRIEYRSQAYRYNGKVLPIIKNLFGGPDLRSDGFTPAEGTMPIDDPIYGLPRHGLLEFPTGEPPSDDLALRTAQEPFWDLKVRYLRDLANAGAAEGTQLFMVHTPIFGLSRQAHEVWIARMRALAGAIPNTTLVDICEFSHPAEFANRPDLFKDFAHLNPAGANLFSKILSRALKEHLGPPSARPGVAAAANPSHNP
jgi:hypothetical protein